MTWTTHGGAPWGTTGWSLAAVLGVWANGLFGYRYLDRLSPGFYYRPDAEKLRLWLAIDGAFLTLFAAGSVLFLLVVFGGVRYPARDDSPDVQAAAPRTLLIVRLPA